MRKQLEKCITIGIQFSTPAFPNLSGLVAVLCEGQGASRVARVSDGTCCLHRRGCACTCTPARHSGCPFANRPWANSGPRLTVGDPCSTLQITWLTLKERKCTSIYGNINYVSYDHEANTKNTFVMFSKPTKCFILKRVNCQHNG